MLFDIYSMVLRAVSGLLIDVLLLRFWMQAIHMRPPYNVGEFVYTLSDWLVKPMRKIIPGVGGLDWASLISALLIAVLAAVLQIVWFYSLEPVGIIKIALMTLVTATYWGLFFLLLLMVAISWINPHAPIAPFVYGLLNPLLRPIRRVIPTIGNIDFSAMVLMLILVIAFNVATMLIARL